MDDSLTPDRPISRLRLIVVVASFIAATAPLIALTGWLTHSPALRQVLPGAIAMNPVTAIALLLLAMGLRLAGNGADYSPTLRRALSGLVIILGSARLFGLTLDLLFFRNQIMGLDPAPRMAHSTAICLVALGVALLLYQPGARIHRLSRPVILPAAMFALLAATGYLYSAEWFFHLPALHPMALNTAIALLALSIGTAALFPPLAPIRQLVDDGVGGATARRLWPAAFLSPCAPGYLRVMGERGGYFDLGFGTAAFAVLTALCLAMLVLLSVKQVRATEDAHARLAQAIRDSEKRTLRLLDGLPTAVFVVDAAGHPYYVNRKSAEILGRGVLPDAEPGDLPKRYQAYFRGTDEPIPADRIQVVRALDGEESYSTDVEIRRPDRIVPLEVWASPIRDDSGKIDFAVAAFNDITDRLEIQGRLDQLNAELARQVTELAAVNKELETFSYSVSHDLRAPLRAIDGFSQALETDYAASLDPEAIRYLSRIRSNVRRMGLLIDDLLRFSRLSRKELETQEVDMASLVRNVLDDLARSRQHPRIRMNELPPARGDIDLLRQVWINLIDNAIKYSGKRSKPRVDISGHRNGHEITYTVRDNGVGFDMAYADKLFGVFQRLHRQDEFEGTGVGLAIVQRVIHRHGGRIWAEAAPDGGATFHFTLPAGGQNGGS